MYHNLIFEELNGTKHFLSWNPTKITTDYRERNLIKTLDGPPLVRVLDSTEEVNAFIWEDVPVSKTFHYDQIRGLVGKTGYIHYNKLPVLVGRKNLLPYSFYNPKIANYLVAACLIGGYFISDGSCVAPDGISMVYLWNRDTAVTTTGGSCIRTPASDFTFSEHNVFSVHVKKGIGTPTFGINLRNEKITENNTYVFAWSGNRLIFNSASTNHKYTCGVEYAGSGWYRPWVYLDIKDTNYDIGSAMTIYTYPQRSAVEDGYPQECNYVWGLQLEAEVDRPTWYAHTEGSPIDQPYLVEFLDLNTEYVPLPGTVKHNLVLTYKVIGAYV